VETAEIDHRLRHHRDVERQWADHLYELDEHPTYRLLAAGEMGGETGHQTNSITAEAPQLWGMLGELRGTLDQVEELQEDRGVFGGKNNEEIAGLLTSTEQLTADFRNAYEPVRDVVARVDAVWRDLIPRIDAATGSLTRAEALCDRLDMRLPEVRLARQRLDAVRSSVSDDPLSLSKNVGPDLDALVSDAARAAGNIERAHGSLDTDLAATDVQVTQLRVLRARAAAAYSEAEAKVVPATPLIRIPSPAVIDGPGGLSHRVTQILGGPEGWQDRRAALDRWNLSADRLRTQLTRALEVNTAPIARRDELRGLLRAYGVKASANPALSDSVLQLGQAAHDELYTRPSDLARAGLLIDEFAAALSA
jgi:hypothetical protein